MALKNTKWYVNYGNGSSTGHYAVGAWVANTAKSVGALIRATAPAVGSERIFVCVVAGTTHGTTEPTWTVTKGAKTDDNDIDWYEITGQPAMNGDATNTPPWATGQATAVGYIIKNTAATYYFICTTSSGNTGAGEPTWDTTAGNTTNDGSNVWTCLGAVGGFSAWGAPHARLANAFASTWGVAGDTFWLSDNHAETQATAMTLTSPGTAAAPCQILCVNDAAAPPTALLATATVTTTGNNALAFSGAAYSYGVSYSCGSGAVSTILDMLSTTVLWTVEAGQLAIPGTSGGRMDIGGTAANGTSGLVLKNSTLKFGATGQTLRVRNRFRWQNTASAIVGTVPTTLFTTTSAAADIEVDGVDLSAAGSGKNLVDASNSTQARNRFLNCKLGASVTPVTGTPTSFAGVVAELINCDSTDTNYRYYCQDYFGTVQQETTIVRTGGASDGTTAISRKMVSSANTQFYSPLVLHPITIWNETTGSSITATVEVVTDNVTLTDAEAWLEVEYLGTSGFPLSLFASDRSADILATPANQTTSSVTWTTTGLSTPVKQKLSVSFTPQEKGPITFRVHLAKASTTVYVCPKVDIA